MLLNDVSRRAIYPWEDRMIKLTTRRVRALAQMVSVSRCLVRVVSLRYFARTGQAVFSRLLGHQRLLNPQTGSCMITSVWTLPELPNIHLALRVSECHRFL
jgi:hypothetical protein